jgi:hypothetical protein
MSQQTLTSASRWLVIVSSLLLLGALSLPWHRASIEVAGVVDIDATVSGWNGVGFVAGLTALGLVLLQFAPRHRMREATRVALSVVGAIVVVAAAIAAALTGDADVQTTNVGVEVGDTLWAAWAGIVLALSTAVGAFGLLLARELPWRHPVRARPHGA